MDELVGLPGAQPFETPSSWLARAALSQGISPRDLLAFIGLDQPAWRRIDLDLLLSSAPGQRALRTRSGLAHMPVATRVLQGLQSVDRKGEILLRDESGRARCRYCPQCMKEHRIAHLEVHGRFAPWRYCPIHDCLMEDRCPHCAATIVLPFDMINGGPRGGGIAFLHQCCHCARELHAVQPVSLERLQITEFDRLCLHNGRALMAALYCSKARMGEGCWVPLGHLKHYLRGATFWRPQSWIAAHEVRVQRTAVMNNGAPSVKEISP